METSTKVMLAGAAVVGLYLLASSKAAPTLNLPPQQVTPSAPPPLPPAPVVTPVAPAPSGIPFAPSTAAVQQALNALQTAPEAQVAVNTLQSALKSIPGF